MKNKNELITSICLVLVILISFTMCQQKDQQKTEHNTLSKAEARDGWTLLFNGKDTENWRGVFKESMPGIGWFIHDDAFCVNIDTDSTAPNAGDIISTKQYGDFDLKWEWCLMHKGDNSGLKYYYKEYDEEQNRYGLGLEYQILDDSDHEWMINGKMKPNDYHTMGALYELYPPSETKKVNPIGEWNTSRIISSNNHVEHWLLKDLVYSIRDI